MSFRFLSSAIATSLLIPVLFSTTAFASTEESNNRFVFYGVGVGMGAIICDFLENNAITDTLANLAVSNMRTEIKTDETYTEYPLGPIRAQAVKDGFNTVTKKMENCDLKF